MRRGLLRRLASLTQQRLALWQQQNHSSSTGVCPASSNASSAACRSRPWRSCRREQWRECAPCSCALRGTATRLLHRCLLRYFALLLLVQARDDPARLLLLRRQLCVVRSQRLRGPLHQVPQRHRLERLRQPLVQRRLARCHRLGDLSPKLHSAARQLGAGFAGVAPRTRLVFRLVQRRRRALRVAQHGAREHLHLPRGDLRSASRSAACIAGASARATGRACDRSIAPPRQRRAAPPRARPWEQARLCGVPRHAHGHHGFDCAGTALPNAHPSFLCATSACSSGWMRSPPSSRKAGRASAGGTPGAAALASPAAGPSGGGLPSPRSASAAKRARYSQRGSLASAGGTELLQVRRTAVRPRALSV